MPVGRLQLCDEARARRIHGILIEIAGRTGRWKPGPPPDRSVSVRRARQRARDQLGGEILVFHVDAGLGGRDGGQVQGLAFPHLRGLPPGGLGAGQPDARLFEHRLDGGRPGGGRRRAGRISSASPVQRRQRSRKSSPERRGGGTVDQGHDLVAAGVASGRGGPARRRGSSSRWRVRVPPILPDVARRRRRRRRRRPR